MSRALLGRSRSRHGGSAFSSCPNFARATKCPIPGDATSLSFSTRALQARAGHASFSATSLYIDLAGEAFRGEAELLERRLLRVEDSGRKSPSVTSMPRQERLCRNETPAVRASRASRDPPSKRYSGSCDRRRFRRLLVLEPRQPFEPLRQVPVPVAEQLHSRRQEHGPHD